MNIWVILAIVLVLAVSHKTRNISKYGELADALVIVLMLILFSVASTR